MKKMVCKATKIERQLKSRGTTQGTAIISPQYNSRWPQRGENKLNEETKDKTLATNPTRNPKAPTAR